jgi:hypothetical protein
MSVRVAGVRPCSVFFSWMSWRKVFVCPLSSRNSRRRMPSVPPWGRSSASKWKISPLTYRWCQWEQMRAEISTEEQRYEITRGNAAALYDLDEDAPARV